MKKRVLKWVMGILLAPVVLFFILAALIYMPPVQNFVVRKATVYASDVTGMDVRIERLRLTFLFDVDLRGVRVTDASEDVILDVERLKVDVSLLSLFTGDVDVEAIELERGMVNTKSLIGGVEIKGSLERFFVDAHGVRPGEELVAVDNVLLSGANVDVALTNDTTEQDTTSSTVNWRIELENVALEETKVRFSMPGDSMSVKAGIRQAVLKKGSVDLGQAKYAALRFDLHADSIFYDVPYMAPVEGVDVNHLALRDAFVGLDSIMFDGNSMALSLAVRESRDRKSVV